MTPESETPTCSTKHSTFTIERTFAAQPARVFAAWASREAKARWFVGTMEGEDDFALDFRVDGVETARGGPPGGPVFTYTATYHDIVADRRIAYSYVMDQDDIRMSLSLATVELAASGSGTRMIVTEHGAYFDGLDTPEARQHGVTAQMDKLGTTL